MGESSEEKAFECILCHDMVLHDHTIARNALRAEETKTTFT